ncbi:MAG TPA: AraC family transcriptional regulator [Planctomycetota bacterium]|nr:AraC family transcriptional regulator [Planctomycetota bacterium]
MRGRVLWPGDDARRISPGLTISGIGVRDAMPPCLVDRRAGTADWLFMHFATPVVVWHDGAMRPFPAHTFFLWSPGNRHSFGNTRRAWSHDWMHGSGEVVERAVRAAGLPLNQPLSFTDAYAVDPHLEGIYGELTRYVPPDGVIVESLVRIWVRSLDRAANPARHKLQPPQRILDALRAIEARIGERITLGDLARAARLSVSRFSAEFGAHVGASPIDYVLQLRLRHATHLLRDHNLSIGEVATRVGFADQFYFSRQFRRRYGVSPMQYRRRLDPA